MAKKPDLLPGTLDMLILKTLARAPLHGYGVALSIKRISDDVLTVEEGSLYPALQRLATAGLGKGGMEDDGDETESAVLYAHRCGTQAIGHRVVAV